MKATDVIIAGAGLIGLTTAYYLVRQGLSVRVLDAGRVGREASWAGGGILWPLYAWRYPEAVQRMAQHGRAIYPKLCEDLLVKTGIDAEYRESGLLLLDEFEAARQWCARHDEPVQPASALNGTSRLSAGLLLPGVGQVRNPRLCQALAVALRTDGVALHESEPVVSVVTDNGRFTGMLSGNGFYPADIGIVAAGAWSSHLLPRLEIFPVKGQMLLLRGAPGQLPHILLDQGRYVIPRADGHILVGSTVEDAGFNKQIDARVETELRGVLDSTIPELARAECVRHWAGLRPGTADGVPYVGAVPDSKGLYVNAGHHRNGVVMAPASAQLLVEMIVSEAQRPMAHDYRIAR